MANSLTDDQKKFLKNLREGNYATINIQPSLSTASQKDFITFRNFLLDNGHTNIQPDDMYVTVLRQNFLDLLNYANDRQCLVLQCCFGFDVFPINVPPNRVIGQVRLIQKGNFAEIRNRKDDDFFYGDTVYRNGDGNFEMFLGMNYGQAILPGNASIFIGNFRAIYPSQRTPENNPYVFGYLLPVKALVKILKDPAYPFVNSDLLTFRWGLTSSHTSDDLGNFTLVIGTHDLLIDSTIEFRIEKIPREPQGSFADALPPCPPTPGCQI